jgi:hypothetical protein
MSLTIIEEQGPSLTDADAAALEARLGKRLPASYRRFLLANNGGIPVPNTADVPGLHQSPTDVQELFGLGLEIGSSCIDWNIETFVGRLDPHLLPVGRDSGGNVFCLSLRAADEGAVIYCDLESVYGDYGKAPPLYQVAADFDQFLSSLRAS